MIKLILVITCEHGGNDIPAPYRGLFEGQNALLDTHRGYDLGALAMARQMARRFNAPLFAATRSRMLVDLNRSIGHPKIFSGITRALEAKDKENILKRYYAPHRDKIQRAIGGALAGGHAVLHIAVHSFTPVLEGRIRNMDVGLLYDPRRKNERLFCRQWNQQIQMRYPKYHVRSNAPYKGISDGLATHFRRLFSADYVGIELELNQSHFLQGKTQWHQLCVAVLDGLGTTMASYGTQRKK